MQPKKMALLAKEAALDKKAEEISIMDVSKLTNVAHYFVVATGNSDRQVRAIADNIVDEFKKEKVTVLNVEGVESGNWVLVDTGSVIIHVFHRDTRDFYGIERLWGEAPRL